MSWVFLELGFFYNNYFFEEVIVLNILIFKYFENDLVICEKMLERLLRNNILKIIAESVSLLIYFAFRDASLNAICSFKINRLGEF